MARFYQHLWAEQKPPLEALRAAQLFIYRHPALIPDLAGERGPPNQKRAVTVRDDVTKPGEPGKSERAPAKLWAAFVLSGTGR
jgi:CHAT domain-containing protein